MRQVFVGAPFGPGESWIRHRRALHPALECMTGLTLIAMVVGCGGSASPTSPSPQGSPSPQVLARALPLSQDSANFTYHYSAGDSVGPQHEEAWFAWAVAHLGVNLPQKVQYYKYTSTIQMQQITGVGKWMGRSSQFQRSHDLRVAGS